MRSLRLSFARALVAATLLTGTAHAADKSPDAVRAEALFDEGRRLMQAGDFAAACPKFAESQTLDQAPGTALNLATCYEKAGKLASAWAAYRSAEAASSSSKQKDRAAYARKKVAALQPKLSRLTITVPSAAAVPGLQIQVDDQPVQAPEWSVPVPHDGGNYTIQASAPGKETWVLRIDLARSEQNLVVEVRTLADAPKPAPQASAAGPTTGIAEVPVKETSGPSGATPGKTQRTIAYVVGGIGVAGMAGAGVLAVLGKTQMNKANKDQSPTEAKKAVNLGNAATVAVSAGGALAATGLILWLAAPRTPVTVGTDGTELFLSGTF
jgi:tetratricopeptide (TPR) repeat protein